MRPESNWECNVCEACGVCSGTLKECETYHEFYGMEEIPTVKAQLADGPAVIPTAIPQQDIMNRGIINRLTGRIINVIEGDVMAQLTIEVGPDNYISSMMPIEKYLESGKNIGDMVTAVFKAVNVLIMR